MDKAALGPALQVSFDEEKKFKICQDLTIKKGFIEQIMFWYVSGFGKCCVFGSGILASRKRSYTWSFGT